MAEDKKAQGIKELTPEAYMCAGISACPSVFETDDGDLLIIGKILDDELKRKLPQGRVGEDEYVVKIPRGLIANIDFHK